MRLLKNEDYNTAYEYFASNGTIVDAHGQNQQASVEQLERLNSIKGELLTYNIYNLTQQKKGAALVTVVVQRYLNSRERSYVVSLTL